jgi:hypothetical protein
VTQPTPTSNSGSGNDASEAVLLSTLILRNTLERHHQEAMALEERRFDWSNQVQALVAQGWTYPQAQSMTTGYFDEVDTRSAELKTAATAERRLSMWASGLVVLGGLGATMLFGSNSYVAGGVTGVVIAVIGILLLAARPAARARRRAASARVEQPFRIHVEGDGVTSPITKVWIEDLENQPLIPAQVIASKTVDVPPPVPQPAHREPWANIPAGARSVECPNCRLALAYITPAPAADGRVRGILHCTACGHHDENSRVA